VVERWNNLESHVVDAPNMISFKNKLKQIRETRMGFYGSPLNPMSLTCGLITVEAQKSARVSPYRIVDISY